MQCMRTPDQNFLDHFLNKKNNKNPGCADYIMIQTRILCTNEIIYLMISEKCTK